MASDATEGFAEDFPEDVLSFARVVVADTVAGTVADTVAMSESTERLRGAVAAGAGVRDRGRGDRSVGSVGSCVHALTDTVGATVGAKVFNGARLDVGRVAVVVILPSVLGSVLNDIEASMATTIVASGCD